MENNQTVSIPPGLALIAANRDYITTKDFAAVTSRANQTIRKNYSTTGSCFGVRPIKFGRKLLWPVAEIAKILNGNGLN